MSGHIRYEGKERDISAKWGDVYLCGNEYRIGDPLRGTPINIDTKNGIMLGFLLTHLGVNVSYEKLGDVSGSKDPRSMMAGIKNQMKGSAHLRFAKRPSKDSSCVRLERRL